MIRIEDVEDGELCHADPLAFVACSDCAAESDKALATRTYHRLQRVIREDA